MEKTTCKFCLEEINEGAKKCPHCQSVLNTSEKKTIFFSVLPFVFLILFFFGLFKFISVMEKKELTSDIGNIEQLEIIETEIVKVNTEYGPSVAVIGKIVNNTDKAFQDILFHIELLDSTGLMIDNFSDYNYDLYVKPNTTTSFRMISLAAKDFDLYKSHKVSINYTEKIR